MQIFRATLEYTHLTFQRIEKVQSSAAGDFTRKVSLLQVRSWSLGQISMFIPEGKTPSYLLLVS